MNSLREKITALEKESIIEALRESNWVMAQAARKLGITERMIGYKIRKYGLRIKEVRWIESTDKRMAAGKGQPKSELINLNITEEAS